MTDYQFHRVLDYFGLEPKGYRKVRKGVKKRIINHMTELECRKVSDYVNVLDASPDHYEQAQVLLSVTISRFFRDRRTWQALEEAVLPRILSDRANPVRIWSAGCASGEEAYSIAIVWDKVKAQTDTLADLELWATDSNPVVLERARKGIYSKSSLREVNTETLTHYFSRDPASGHFIVSGFLKNAIAFRAHDLATEELPSLEFQVIFLRNNLLTYYGEVRRNEALRRILGCLASGGFLVIGSHEEIPQGFDQLAPSNLHPCLIRKVS